MTREHVNPPHVHSRLILIDCARSMLMRWMCMLQAAADAARRATGQAGVTAEEAAHRAQETAQQAKHRAQVLS